MQTNFYVFLFQASESDILRSFAFFEGFKTSPACPSNKSGTEVKMSIEHSLNDTDKGKQNIEYWWNNTDRGKQYRVLVE